MACTSVVPELDAAGRGRYVSQNLPPGLFRIADGAADGVPWRITPEPFPLAPKTVAAIETLGNDLLAFYRALNALYLRSARGSAPAFIAEELDRGKPEQIVKLARQNRFKQDVPRVIRPDLILTEDGYIASELDSVPGGMGFVGAMAHTYCAIGIESAGGADGIAQRFAEMAASIAGVEKPAVAVVVSDESGDYRNELRWLARRIDELELADVFVVTPQEIAFTEDALFVRRDDGRETKIDVLYRNFELFDLLNVPKQELMLYAARHNRVKLTPPPKAHLEEKLSFALFHHPLLRAYWRAELGAHVDERLLGIFPRTWIVDARPLPPQAAVIDLTASGVPVHDWSQLEELGKSERDYVLKPSGYSELAWGSRGVKVANDLTKHGWREALHDAAASFEKTPYILQRFHKGRRVRVPYLAASSNEIKEMDGRVRLCPYYFVVGDETKLGGILATVAPADKRVIHGMSDAIMAPCRVADDGF
ncbi:hypothetical protein WPS_15120 [Vulcanimicrobium alpinum]|uniref:Uncharacterized protein n=1 Tax=Vulcanimicrobium alpinum TaxID=3016050 RepID=A0AAN2C9P3_UNVUL|nr:hypothetical protein [Vulcanimicrobium alpinum]BDE06236.1 hypothetical protein WPS_15120 [Vulcanimicrobium alpinum]